MCVGKCLVSVLYMLSFMCYEWKFKVQNVCSMKVQRIHDQMWGEQQSMIKIVRLFVKFSELRKIFNSWSIVVFGLRKFHALQNLKNKWKLWTLKNFKEALDLENFWVCKLRKFHERSELVKFLQLNLDLDKLNVHGLRKF